MSYLFPSTTFNESLRRLSSETGQSAALMRLSTYSKKRDIHRPFLKKVLHFISENIQNENLSAHDLCNAVNLSYSQFYRRIRSQTGKTPCLLIRSIRLKEAKRLLETTYSNVSEVAYQVGFNDPNYFSRAFRKEFGISPSKIQ